MPRLLFQIKILPEFNAPVTNRPVLGRIYCIFVKQDSFNDSETCISGHLENTFQYLLKEECAWPLFPEWLVGSWKVHLIIESVDNILRCNHSNQWNLFRQYFQILTLGIFQSKKVSTVEPLQSLSYDHLFYMTTSLLRPYIFLTQTQKSLSHFIILKTTLMQPPRYKDQGFIARRWLH